MTDLPPLTAEELAIFPGFADGEWRDEQGRGLPQAICAAFVDRGEANPSKATTALWLAASRLFHDRHPQVIGDPDETRWAG